MMRLAKGEARTRKLVDFFSLGKKNLYKKKIFFVVGDVRLAMSAAMGNVAAMHLYDTISRTMKELLPVDGKKFRFYCCGPTVYGPAHIGNFRTFVLQDVFRRTLETGGIPTMHVRNLTDVDDKTIRESQRVSQSLMEFTAFWTKKFHQDCDKLHCLPPHVEPSAVEHIPQQVAMVQELELKGHAYRSDDGSVYFNIASFPEYGKLSRLDERELELGRTQSQRANADEYEKHSVSDFVLWKARRPEDGANYWPSPWGDGRPGWHLECSAMIREYLGKDFDLHSGGVDLVFPHHENEIAQSRCACGGHFAATWFHIAHLMVDGGKMSKSLGNLYTLEDLEQRGWTAAEVRYVLLSGHYRKPLNFTFESLHAAREALTKLSKAAERISQNCPENAILSEVDFGVFQEAWNILNDDLNTPGALGAVFRSLRTAVETTGQEAVATLASLNRLLRALGIELPPCKKEIAVPPEIQALADERWAARTAKNWAESDALRDKLAAQGWLVKDGKDGYILSFSN
jgi:cysteinyl-tRNA synthetase